MLSSLVDLYSQIEPNEKQKQDTRARLQLLQEKLQTADISASVLTQLLNLLA